MKPRERRAKRSPDGKHFKTPRLGWSKRDVGSTYKTIRKQWNGFCREARKEMV